MSKRNRNISVIFASLLVVILVSSGCKKDNTDDIETSAPEINTGSANMLGQNWATMRASVLSNGLATTVTFEYDTTTAFENSIEATQGEINHRDFRTASALLTGLETTKKYYYRVKAVNAKGTAYGSDTSFVTLNISDSLLVFNPQLSYGSISDIDGNVYKTIQIGTQNWMAENLRTLRLNDGTEIPYIEDYDEWSDVVTPGYCLYKSDSAYYGALYNWYAVESDLLCPDGWSVPSEEDWTSLIDFLGGDIEAGKALKETGTRHWLFTTGDVTNDSGFTALPGGYRNLHGTFGNSGTSGYFWTSTEDNSTTASYVGMYYGYSNVDRGVSGKRTGFSVRCIEDLVTK